MRLSNAQQMMHTFGTCIIHAVLLTMAFLIGFCHYIIQHHSILRYKWIVDLVSIYIMKWQSWLGICRVALNWFRNQCTQAITPFYAILLLILLKADK